MGFSCESSSPSPHPARPPPPSPPGGEGSHGDTRWGAVPGSGADAGFPEGSDEVQALARKRLFPRALDRGGYRHGRWRLAGASPLPCPCLVSSASGLNSSRLPSAGNPLRRRGRCVGISGKKPCPGMQTSGQREKRAIIPPVRVPVIGNRCTMGLGHEKSLWYNTL